DAPSRPQRNPAGPPALDGRAAAAPPAGGNSAVVGTVAATVDAVRIGLVCPYSLSVPGGVQGQVLGLGRVLRTLGHETRARAPCDGPPPEPFVVPLGNSIPTAANGSIAPLAPDASCALRTIRALRDEEFDVVHLHEPLAPGPTQTALAMRSAPLVGT